METTTASPAGADASTEVVSATRAAADVGDVSTFLEADRAARSGKPLDRVERPKGEPAKSVKPAIGKDGAPAKGPSAADREADERLTARVREAVDQSTADLRRQLDDAHRRLSATERKPEPAKAPAAEPKKAEDYKRYLAMPDAPKVEEFDSIVDHNAAMSAFISDKRHEEREQAKASGDRALERTKADIARVQTFHGRIEAFKQTAPDFAAKLTPEVKALHGFARLQQINSERTAQGQPALDATVDHAIAEEIYDSELAPQIALHLSEHPDDMRALRACATPSALFKAFGRLEDKVRASGGAGTTTTADKPPTPADLRERAAAVVERSVSKSDPPSPTLGKAGSGVDPLKAAIDAGDVGMFLDLDRQAMADKRGFRR